MPQPRALVLQSPAIIRATMAFGVNAGDTSTMPMAVKNSMTCMPIQMNGQILPISQNMHRSLNSIADGCQPLTESSFPTVPHESLHTIRKQIPLSGKTPRSSEQTRSQINPSGRRVRHKITILNLLRVLAAAA